MALSRLLVCSVFLVGCLDFNGLAEERLAGLDAGEVDAGPQDAGAPDAGPADAGPTCGPNRLQFVSLFVEDAGVVSYGGVSVGGGSLLLMGTHGVNDTMARGFSMDAGVIVSTTMSLISSMLVLDGAGVAGNEQFTIDELGGGVFRTNVGYAPVMQSGACASLTADAVFSRTPNVGLYCCNDFRVCEWRDGGMSLLPLAAIGGTCSSLRQNDAGEIWRSGVVTTSPGVQRAAFVAPDSGLTLLPADVINVAMFDFLSSGRLVFLDHNGTPRLPVDGGWVALTGAGTIRSIAVAGPRETYLAGADDGLLLYDGQSVCLPEIIGRPALPGVPNFLSVRVDGDYLVLVADLQNAALPVVMTLRRVPR